MNESEIAALAREYAEESANEVGVKFDPQDWACTNCMIEAKNVIKFLLRRFCLVKKNKVEEMYLNAKIAIEKGYDENLGGMMAVGSASKSILESLFPDLGKEME